jgi:hypothetical protein
MNILYPAHYVKTNAKEVIDPVTNQTVTYLSFVVADKNAPYLWAYSTDITQFPQPNSDVVFEATVRAKKNKEGYPTLSVRVKSIKAV